MLEGDEMDNQRGTVYKSFYIVTIMCLIALMLMPQVIYAKNTKTQSKVSELYIWLPANDSYQINTSDIVKSFKIKNANIKMKYTVPQYSNLQVNKKGVVTVKKSAQKRKNREIATVISEFTYKNVKYSYTQLFSVCYEYDDKNCMPGDVNPQIIEKYKEAYKTGNTSNLNSEEKKIFKNVKKAVDYAKSGKNRYEKVKRLNDWMAKNISYDFSSESDSYYLKGPMIKGKAVCNGYANAFKLCSLVMGVPCEMVHGYLSTPKEGHSWNIVKMDDGKWYHIDVTSNDIQTKEKNIYSTYQAFALTDKQMKASGYSWYDSKKCNGTKYNITNYEKKNFIKSEKNLYDAIKEAVQNKKKDLVLYIHSEESLYCSSVNNVFASEYVGRNIEVQSVDMKHYTMPAQICPGNKNHSTFMYKIKYLSDSDSEKIKYMGNYEQMKIILSEAVSKRQTTIKNVAINDEVINGMYSQPEICYLMFGKLITFGYTNSVEVPEFLSPDGGKYSLADFTVYYSEENIQVYEVADDEGVRTALDNALTNRYEKVYFYAPNYNKNIHYILNEYVNHIDSSNSIIKNISSDVYPYQYYNPTEGEWKDSCWVEMNIEY